MAWNEDDGENPELDKIHLGWLAQHPEDQVQIGFPPEVMSFLDKPEDTVVNLFIELDAEGEAAFRKHARETYQVGEEISEILHPVWRDEANKMNKEAGL